MGRIKVNNEYLDMYDDEYIAFDIAEFDFKEIQAAEGTSSYTFSVPNSSKNRRVLGQPTDSNAPLGVVKRKDATYEGKNVIFDRGYILSKIANEREISVVFFTNNSSFFDEISGINLKDVDVSDMDHTLFLNSVVNADFENGYGYPLVQYGLIDFSDNEWNEKIDLRNMLPAIKFSLLIERACALAGYSLSGGFIKSQLYKSIIVASGSSILRSSEWKDDRTVLANTSFMPIDHQEGGESYSIGYGYNSWSTTTGGRLTKLLALWNTRNDDGGQDNLGSWESGPWEFGDTNNPGPRTRISRYRANDRMSVDVEVTIFGRVTTSNSARRWIGVMKNPTDSPPSTPLDGNYSVSSSEFDSDAIQPKLLLFPGQQITGVKYVAENILLEENDTIEIWLSGEEETPFISNFVDIMHNNPSSIKVSPRRTLSRGDTVNMSAVVPDISLRDAISTLHSLCPLRMSTNEVTKEILINRVEDIYNNISKAKDWSQFLDMSEDPEYNYAEMVENYNRNNMLKYEEVDDFYLNSYNQLNRINYGDGRLIIRSGHVYGDGDLFTLPFPATFDLPEGMPAIDLYETTENDELIIKETEQRLLLYRPQGPANLYGVEDITVVGDGFTSDTVTQFDQAYFNSLQTDDVSLCFDEPSNSFGQGQKTLIKRNYSLIENVFKRHLIIKCLFKLTEDQIRNIDTSIPVYVSRFKAYFIINKIEEYNEEDASSIVEIVKIE